MGLLLQHYRAPRCCLCGEKGALTGEHKIKAAMLKQEFGKAQLSVHRGDGLEQSGRIAQSIKSKRLKFRSRICQACNSARTQLPDNEFDKFSTLALQKLKLRQDPKTLWNEKIYEERSVSYLNLFRYFAKLLCCHLAEIDAPIPRRLALFSISRLQNNSVWLDIQRDWTYEKIEAHWNDLQLETQLGKLQYAAHGGLLIYGDNVTGAPTAFHSTVTLGPLQYVFFVHLAPIEVLELKYLYRDFYNWCCSRAEHANKEPLSDDEQRRLGFLK